MTRLACRASIFCLLAACGEDESPEREADAEVGVAADAAVADAAAPDAGPADATPPDASTLLPNLILLPERIIPTIHPLLDEDAFMNFGPQSCSVAEGMATRGRRWMLRFDTATMNDGPVDLFLGAPPEEGTSSDMFEWAPCHGHHHFTGYAKYELVDLEGNTVVKNNGEGTVGRKMAFCLENTDHIDPESPTPKDARDCKEGDTAASRCNYTCKFQGISAGWADTYWKSLAGQWIDICNVEPGMYRLKITINGEQRLPESSYDDNVFETPVQIPVMPSDVSNLCEPVEP